MIGQRTVDGFEVTDSIRSYRRGVHKNTGFHPRRLDHFRYGKGDTRFVSHNCTTVLDVSQAMRKVSEQDTTHWKTVSLNHLSDKLAVKVLHFSLVLGMKDLKLLSPRKERREPSLAIGRRKHRPAHGKDALSERKEGHLSTAERPPLRVIRGWTSEVGPCTTDFHRHANSGLPGRRKHVIFQVRTLGTGNLTVKNSPCVTVPPGVESH